MAPLTRISAAALQLFLCVIAERARLSKSAETSSVWFNRRCNGAGAVQLVSGLEGMAVNLTVSCDRNIANLKATSGGLAVSELRLAQECSSETGINQSTLHGVDVIYSRTERNHETDIPPVSPEPAHQLEQSDMECKYFGCYMPNQYSYNDRYYFTFSTVTCTFMKVLQAPSTKVILPSPTVSVGFSSENSKESSATSEIKHHRNSYSSEYGTNPSYSSPQDQFSSTFTKTSTIMAQQAQSTVDFRSGESNQRWMVLISVIVLITVTVVLFIACFSFFIIRFCRVTHESKECLYYESDVFNKEFFPVQVLKPSLTPSFSYLSITTKLDELQQSKSNLDTKAETDVRDQTYGDQIFKQLLGQTNDEINLTDHLDSSDHTKTFEEFDDHSDVSHVETSESDVVLSQKQHFPVPTSMANGSNSYVVEPLKISTDRDVDQQQKQLDHFCLDLDSESGSSLVKMEEPDSKSEQLNGTSTVLQSSLSENHCHTSMPHYHRTHIYSLNATPVSDGYVCMPNANTLELVQHSLVEEKDNYNDIDMYCNDKCDENVVSVQNLDRNFLQEQQLVEVPNMRTNSGYITYNNQPLMDGHLDSKQLENDRCAGDYESFEDWGVQ